MKKQNVKADGITILLVIFIVSMIILSVLPELLGQYDIMVGKTGLENTISAILIRTFSALFIAIPFVIFGVCTLRDIIKKRNEQKNFRLSVIMMVLLTVSVPLILFRGNNRTHYSEQQNIIGKEGIFGDIGILAGCVSDHNSDEYDEYVVNEISFDKQKHISATGKRGRSYHNEYVLKGYNNGVKLFEAQIGREDYNSFIRTLPKGFDITVTVYKKSGFIRSVQQSVDFGREESSEHFFEISVSGDKIVRSENLSAYELDNLTWCEFHKGGSIDYKNALCGINAENSLEYSGFMMGEEICLYAWVDGGYKRVSNVICKEEISQ